MCNWNVKKKLIAASLAGSMLFGSGIGVAHVLLGIDTTKDEQPMAVIPAGAIFAAENIDKNSYTFISCATTPRFDYKGFRLVQRAELKKIPGTIGRRSTNGV